MAVRTHKLYDVDERRWEIRTLSVSPHWNKNSTVKTRNHSMKAKKPNKKAGKEKLDLNQEFLAIVHFVGVSY